MPGRQARIITPSVLRRMVTHVGDSYYPARDRVIILLSVKAGLRAAEIAQLDWSMVLDIRGQIDESISLHDAIAKKRSGRRIPMHQDLRQALSVLYRQSKPHGPGPHEGVRCGPTAS
jgi:integrase